MAAFGRCVSRYYFCVALSVALLSGASAHADFLDLTSVTAGTSGSFSGTLGGVSVSGSISPINSGTVQFNVTGPDSSWEASTTDNSSQQFSYGNIFTPSTPLTDRVGYTSFGGTENKATITISFGSSITNPIFEVANLDSMQYDFSGTAGLGGLVLLSGNAGAGDGIQVVGNVISDILPLPLVGQPASDPPLTSGFRGAYGSVEIVGTFTTLTIGVDNPSLNGDGGSFTLATPLPATAVGGSVLLLVVAGVQVVRRRGARAF